MAGHGYLAEPPRSTWKRRKERQRAAAAEAAPAYQPPTAIATAMAQASPRIFVQPTPDIFRGVPQWILDTQDLEKPADISLLLWAAFTKSTVFDFVRQHGMLGKTWLLRILLASLEEKCSPIMLQLTIESRESIYSHWQVYTHSSSIDRYQIPIILHYLCTCIQVLSLWKINLQYIQIYSVYMYIDILNCMWMKRYCKLWHHGPLPA